MNAGLSNRRSEKRQKTVKADKKKPENCAANKKFEAQKAKRIT